MPSPEPGPLSVCLNLTRAISRTDSLADIYTAALDALATGLGVDRAAILLFDADGVMRFKAWRGLSDAYRSAVEGHTPWTPLSKNSQPIVIADCQADSSLAAHRPAFAAEHIDALAFIPLEDVGGVIGKFMLYYRERHEPSPDELEFAAVVAAQVAFAVSRTRTQLVLRDNEERLRFALEAAHMGTWDWDLRANTVVWSDNVERIHGLEAGTFDGTFQSYEREIHPDDQARVLASIQRALNDGGPHEVEYRLVAPDGTIRWVEGKGHVEYGADGKPYRMTGVCMNVTPRKHAEIARVEALELSHRASQRLAAIVESSDDAIVSKNLDGTIISWNQSAERMFGFTAAEAIGRHILLIVPHDRRAEEELVLSTVCAGQSVEMETVRRRKDGSFIDISLKVSPVKDRTGRIVGASKIARDISARIRDEAERAELHEEQRRQRRAAEIAHSQATFLADAAAVLSRSLDYEQTLAAVARLAVPAIADWCAVDMVGQEGRINRLAIAHADPRKVEHLRSFHEGEGPDPAARGGVREVLRTARPILMEAVPPRLPGIAAPDEQDLGAVNQALTSYMCVPLVSARGTLGAMTFVFAESERHYSERDLLFAQDLAARVVLAIDNAVAYRRAHEANRLKDEFLATLSHELRTPLNAILGYAQMLMMGLLNGEARSKALTVLTRNAEALRQIIDDVLDVSRITSGKLRLNVRPVDLVDVLRNAIATVQPAADAKGVTIRIQAGADVGMVSGDPDRLQQVLWNLLSNGVKFTPRNGVVQVHVERLEQSVEIVVSDSGQGVTAAFLPFIFERFRQADSRFSREHGGLGLGLAIVRELVELHGGTVTASSDGPGTGAAFTLRFPTMANASPPAVVGPPVAAFMPMLLSGEPRERLSGSRVLIVDDQDDALGLLRVILESAGAEVTSAASAQRALDLLLASSYDALIADIGMPGMDGLDLIRQVRQTLPAPANRIPAAALTAFAKSDDRLTALASGFQTHVAKPVNPRELVATVAALISR